MDEKMANRGRCERACHQAENIEKKLQYGCYRKIEIRLDDVRSISSATQTQTRVKEFVHYFFNKSFNNH